MLSAKSWLAGLVLAGVTGLAAVQVAIAQDAAPSATAGAAVFDARCKGCHDPAIGRAPAKSDLAQRPQADIVQALTSGIMVPMAQGLSPADIKAVAAYLSPAAPAAAPQARTGGVEMPQVAINTGAVGVDPMCASNPPIKAAPGDWSNMGVDDASSRFQRHPGLTGGDIKRLKVKWSFSMVGGGQPAVVGDWLYATNRNGKFYALSAKTGCVHWVVSDLVARTTPIVIHSKISPSGWAVIVGESDRIIRTFDAQTGKEIWRSPQLEAHPSSVLTGSPVVAGDRVLVPISSIEEATSMSKAYACCTFRGSIASLDLATGKLQWKTSMIDEPRQVIRQKEGGQEVSGPAGAAIWGAPSLNLKKGLVYVVTGDSYTDIDTTGDDSIEALEIKTGKVRWHTQVTQHDNFVMGCGPASKTGNCPTPLGPDYDFGASPVLVTLHDGKQMLIAGQKSGLAYGLNPDTGKVMWKTAVGVGSALGGIEWGIGSDNHYAYIPVSDLGAMFAEMRPARPGQPAAPPAKPGVSALDPMTGTIVWYAPAPKAPCVYASDKGKPSHCARAQSPAPAIIPGYVFEGGLDGWFRAYDAKTGKIVWEYSTTAQTYDTLNGIKGQPGGGIDGMGPTIAHGMVYLTSGNNGAVHIGSNGVNVLLAFSVDGK
jgi:polyvinyl alcohol dehydrogenase (cytochrome)